MATRKKTSERGPFHVDQLRPGDRYELSRGHPIYCAPTGQDGARANLVGAEVLDTDPDVEAAGIDAGFALDEGTLRAPDIAVGAIEDRPGWARKGPPALAVEYAGRGQAEEELQEKIRDLLAAGTRYVWVVRLETPRRVEVHEPQRRMKVRRPGQTLEAAGVLRNPVPVEALFDRRVAHEYVLRNLLQRRGYESLDAVRAEGREEGELAALRTSLLDILRVRGLEPTAQQAERIGSCSDAEVLRGWLRRAVTAQKPAQVFAAR